MVERNRRARCPHCGKVLMPYRSTADQAWTFRTHPAVAHGHRSCDGWGSEVREVDWLTEPEEVLTPAALDVLRTLHRVEPISERRLAELLYPMGRTDPAGRAGGRGQVPAQLGRLRKLELAVGHDQGRGAPRLVWELTEKGTEWAEQVVAARAARMVA